MRGWFAVADAAAVDSPTLIEDRLGRPLVAWRAAGAVRVAGAHCPHLGADLSMGSVKDDRLRCPFHGWEFDPDGSLARIPYSPCGQRSAGLAVAQTQERLGLVWAWSGPGEPFEVGPLEPEVDGWVCARRYARTTSTNISDTLENGVDIGHFNQLHEQPDIQLVNCELPDGPYARVDLAYEAIDATVGIDYFGPGLVVLRFRGFVEMAMTVAYTPSGEHPREGSTHLHVAYWLPADRSDDALSAYLIAEITRQLDQDIAVWDRKVYLERPALCAGDGPMLRMRRWVGSFA